MRIRKQRLSSCLGWKTKTIKYVLIGIGYSLLVLPACALPTYSVTSLPHLPGDAVGAAYGINDSNQVVGYSQGSNGNSNAVLWSGGTIQNLGPLPGGKFSVALNINQSGQVVGWSYDSLDNQYAVLWSNGSIQNLGALPGAEFCWANGINYSGQIVIGSSYNSIGVPQAILWSGGTIQNLGSQQVGSSGGAYGINIYDQVVGWSGDSMSSDKAVLWSEGTIQDLGTLPGKISSGAIAINDYGQVVGWSYDSMGNHYAALWSNGTLQDLGKIPGWIASEAYDINNSGQIVGWSYDSINKYQAVLWSEGTILNLGTLLGNLYSQAFGINSSGQISGYAWDSLEHYRAVIWSLVGAWDNAMGTFDADSDISYFAYENAPNVSNQPTVNWLSTYQGHTGILQIAFGTSTEGLKMTSLAQFTTNTSQPWYRIRVVYSCDSPCDNESILPVILVYTNNTSQTIQELGASYTGNSLIQPYSWYTIDAYIYCHDSSGQLQLIMKNGGSSGAMYIDSIELDNIVPPAISNPVYVTTILGVPISTGSDTTHWGFDTTYNAGSKPQVSWLSSFSGMSDIVELNFDTTNQSMKMTSLLGTIPANRNAILSFNVYMTNPTDITAEGFIYGEKSLNPFECDIAGYANIGIIPANTWTTIYVPLSSVSQQTSFRLQLLVKNNNQFPEQVYINGIQLFYSSVAGYDASLVDTDKPTESSDKKNLNFQSAVLKSR